MKTDAVLTLGILGVAGLYILSSFKKANEYEAEAEARCRAAGPGYIMYNGECMSLAEYELRRAQER